MNILVINPASTDKTINRDMAGGLGFSAGEGIVLPPLDLLNIVATLKNKKHKVVFLDAVAERIDDFSPIMKLIKEAKIEIVVGNLSLPTLTEDIAFYKKLKSKYVPLKVLIKTGIQYKNILKRVLKETKVDQIINSECDLNIDAFIKGAGKAESVTDVNKLPIADRKATKINLYKYSLLPGGKCTTIQTSRGCPYPCGYYCPYPLVQGRRWRAMSPERVMKELVAIKKLGIERVLFRDATFTLDMERAEMICRLMIKKKLGLQWWCETRINVLNEKLLRIMHHAGCKGINVGIETLDEELIKSEGKPGVKLEDVQNIRRLAKKLHIKLHFLMIVGLPNDSLKGLATTLEYIVKLRPESLGITAITPYPGTKLFDEAKKNRLISNFNWNDFNGANSNMRTKFLTESEIELARKLLMAAAMFSNWQWPINFLGVNLVRIIFRSWRSVKGQ